MDNINRLERIPVILDTDLGSDIDDSWALAMLLNSNELDLKYVLTASGDTTYRAAIAAKLLEAAGRSDIPIGIGVPTSELTKSLARWIEDYNLSDYPGEVHIDGIEKGIEIIRNSPVPVTIIAIGPMTNIAAMLKKEPSITQNSRLVCMLGSVRKGYYGYPEINCEYNVAVDPQACAEAFAASWDITITPVDTCGDVRLTGANYDRILSCKSPLIRAVLESYREWNLFCHNDESEEGIRRGSSILFDTVAVYLAYTDELLNMEMLGLKVSAEGFTIIDDTMKPINCATTWKSLPEFEQHLTNRLCGL